MTMNADAPCPEGMTVRELFAIMQERERTSILRYEAQEKATKVSADAAEKRFELLNELRKVVSDQATGFLHRNEYTIQFNVITDRIGTLNDRMTALESALAAKKEGLGIIGALVLGSFAVLSALVSVVTLIVHIYRP